MRSACVVERCRPSTMPLLPLLHPTYQSPCAGSCDSCVDSLCEHALSELVTSSGEDPGRVVCLPLVGSAPPGRESIVVTGRRSKRPKVPECSSRASVSSAPSIQFRGVCSFISVCPKVVRRSASTKASDLERMKLGQGGGVRLEEPVWVQLSLVRRHRIASELATILLAAAAASGYSGGSEPKESGEARVPQHSAESAEGGPSSGGDERSTPDSVDGGQCPASATPEAPMRGASTTGEETGLSQGGGHGGGTGATSCPVGEGEARKGNETAPAVGRPGGGSVR